MSNTKETKPRTKNERAPLIERAAALIKKDASSGLAGDYPPPLTAEDPHGIVEVEPNEASYIASQHGPTRSEQNSHSKATDEAVDRKTQSGGNDLIHFDKIKSRRLNILTPGLEHSRSVEEFRQIKRSVLNRMYVGSETAEKNKNLILVTSSRPNEGKTFVSINLAISMALEKDLSILLIDVDQTDRGIRDTLGISKSSKGLNDVIEDDSLTLADVIIDTDIDGLSVIPAGTYHPLGTELISSAKMTEILADLAKARHGTVVIFDAPPVLATTEAAILAQQVGQVVFVIEAGKTSQATIQDALEIIGYNENIGFVLNKTRVVVGDSQFGSYYSYGYGKSSAA